MTLVDRRGTTWRPWEDAWRDALYGPRGFYRRPEGPAGHFRTAAHASTSGLLGSALARLARLAGCDRIVDVGAGRGELLRAVRAADSGLHLLGVEVAPRPASLPADIGWAAECPTSLRACLLVGWEWLDVVPCPVLEVDDAGTPRVVEVAACGRERLGRAAAGEDLRWCDRWWPPGRAAGTRVEVGRTRDAAWSAVVGRLADGVALAVDYGHAAGDRPSEGSLGGYRGGRRVPPVPDGTCDVTAHVALDAVAATRPGVVRLRQREALGALLPAAGNPAAGAAGHLEALARAGEVAELRDPGSLGGFGWLLHPVGARAVEGLDGLGWTPTASA